MNDIINHLRQSLHRFHCPEAEQLHALYWEQVSAAEKTQIQTHIDTCFACQAEYETLQAFLLEEADAKAPNLLTQTADAARVLIARLLPTTSQSKPQFALRGSAEAMVFEVGDTMLLQTSVVLDERGYFTLHGTVSAVDVDFGGQDDNVRLTEIDTQVSQTTTLDSMGTFIIKNLDPNVYQLKIQLADNDILVPLIEIRSRGLNA